GVVGDKPLAAYRIQAEAIGGRLAAGEDPDTPLPKRGAAKLGAAFDEYLIAKSGKLAASTITNYKSDIESFYGPSWRALSLRSAFDPEQVSRRHRARSDESLARANGG